MNFDASRQALGRYQGDRTLFLGFGTGLGPPLIFENVWEPMELVHLPYKKSRSYEDSVGAAALKRQGKESWRHRVNKVVQQLKAALEPDYVVLGGGTARLRKKLPLGTRLGINANAFESGYRLWTKAYSGSTHARFVYEENTK